jgi:hypothetical protein
MARTLEQIDTALAAVEVQLPRVQNGLTTTVQQATLVLESEITELAGAVGAPAASTPATGLFGDVANLTTLLADLQARVAALEAAAAVPSS